MSLLKRMKIAVIGGGYAGPATALFLSCLPNTPQITLFDKQKEPNPNIGAGIALQPTGIWILDQLSNSLSSSSSSSYSSSKQNNAPNSPYLDLNYIYRHSSKVDNICARTIATGSSKLRPVLDINYSEISSGCHSFGLQRGVLFDAFHRCISTIDDDILKTIHSVCIEDILKDRVLIDSEKNEYGPFDLVVVASGAFSELRSSQLSIFQHSSITPSIVDETYDWGTLWCNLERDESDQFSNSLIQYFNGTKKMTGLLPSGFAYSDTSLTKPISTLFYSMHYKDVNKWKEEGINKWVDDMNEWIPSNHPQTNWDWVKEQLLTKKTNDIIYSQYAHAKVCPPAFSDIGIVYVGDCSHASAPTLGLGTTLALLDAFWIYQSFLSQENTSNSVIEKALVEYSNSRKWQTYYYSAISKALNPFFQSSKIPGLHLIRDFLFNPMNKIPLARRIMLESVAGFTQGPLPWMTSPLKPKVLKSLIKV